MQVKSLDKKYKELLFAFSAFGPNFLMVLMSAYFTDAVNPVALVGDSYQAIASGTCFILPAVFPVLYTIAKAFDGIIDIPFAHITDTLSTKWGRRRPAILVCMIPMIISFALCWIPIGGANNQLLNTIWIIFWSLIFFSTYTMCLIAFYGSLSTVCCDEPQRLRVSSYKSFFDTISYCMVYALVPLLLDGLKLHIDQFVLVCLPLMLTISIPLFLIKEGEKYGYPENVGLQSEKIKIFDSIRLTFKNRLFRSWVLVNGCVIIGLQMFLVGMNAMIIGGMGFSGAEMAIINTCAFAPVPIMLYLFNKLKAKKGIRFTFQTCLLAFGLAILSFFFASEFVTGGNRPIQYAIACTGGVLGSWAIGAFFMMPILVQSQVASVEEKLTGKNHAAMYFAGGAVVSSVVGAISTSLVYENIKMLFVNKSNGSVAWAENITDAQTALGSVENVYNLGTLIVPFIVFGACVAGFFMAFKLPYNYTEECIAKEMKKDDLTLDISSVVRDEHIKEEKGETNFIQIALWVLSGGIYGFIWAAFMLGSVKKNIFKGKIWWKYLLCCLVPFAGAVVMTLENKKLAAYAKEQGIKIKALGALHIISGILLPILPVNLISLIATQSNINKIYKAQENVNE